MPKAIKLFIATKLTLLWHLFFEVFPSRGLAGRHDLVMIKNVKEAFLNPNRTVGNSDRSASQKTVPSSDRNGGSPHLARKETWWSHPDSDTNRVQARIKLVSQIWIERGQFWNLVFFCSQFGCTLPLPFFHIFWILSFIDGGHNTNVYLALFYSSPGEAIQGSKVIRERQDQCKR